MKNLSDKQAKATAIGTLVAMGAIATVPIGAVPVLFGVNLSPLIWGVVAVSSCMIATQKPNN